MGMLQEQQPYYEQASHGPQSISDVENPLRRTTSDGSNDYLHSAPLKRSMDSSDSRAEDSTASPSSYSSVTPDSAMLQPCSPPSTEYVLNVAFYSFVGFMTIQAIFAYIAKSEAMMADCEAMMVDAVTYLLNLCAEHYKHRPLTEYELSLPLQQRLYRRELQRHCLEFIPPTISVITLILVTIYTLQDSITTVLAITGHGPSAMDDTDEVSLPIMFTFSFANLMLDILNVTCFTRSGFSVMEWMSACRKEASSTAEMEEYTIKGNERSPLLNEGPIRKQMRSYSTSSSDEDEEMVEGHTTTEVNLNMCSAWTHICADTLRSTAVLIAASIALCIPTSYVHASDMADAVAALAVSVIILCTLIPLIQGLVRTAGHIVRLLRQKDERRAPPTMVALITV